MDPQECLEASVLFAQNMGGPSPSYRGVHCPAKDSLSQLLKEGALQLDVQEQQNHQRHV